VFGKQMEICSLTQRPGFLACSKTFDPALFIDENWAAAEEDERANELTEIDVSTIAVVTGLKKEERYITGEETVKRLKETPYIRLGGRAFLALWENQRLIPESWKKQFVFVYFDGLILLHRNGNRYSIYLSWDGLGWHWYTGWLGNNRSARNTSAVLASA
jgi:hypothetical protein